MKPSLTFWLLIGIILVLVYVMVVPKVGSVHGPSRITVAEADIKGGIKTALDRYKIDNGYYPSNFNDLIQQPSGATKWSGPYLDGIPVDPWGNKYIYELPGKHNPDSYDLMSAGPDGKKGTEDDIGNW